MKNRYCAILAAAAVIWGCSPRNTDEYFHFDTDAVPMGMDRTEYPVPGESGEIPDEAWEGFEYKAEFHIVNPMTGLRLSDSVFAALSVFSDGVAVASDGGGEFYVGKDGRRIIDETFLKATLFSGNRAWVMDLDGEIWAIDKSGNRLFPADGASFVGMFHDGKAVIGTVDGYTKVVDSRGKVLLNMRGDGGYFVVGGLLPMSGKDGLQGLVDMAGEFVVAPEYCSVGLSQWSDVNTYISSISGGRFIVSDGNGWGVIDAGGKLTVPMKYDEIVPDGNLVLAFGKDGAVWFDNEGTKVIDGNFSSASAFGAGDCAAVCKDDVWGFIGRDGGWRINQLHACYAESFDANGRAMFNDYDTYGAGMIDVSGAVMVEPVYDYIYNIVGTDRYMFGKDGYIGIMDGDGKVILPADRYTLYGGDPAGVSGADEGVSHMLIYATEEDF